MNKELTEIQSPSFFNNSRMKTKLPRVMLWTDKSSMEEFLCEPINKRLYCLYLELRGERWHFGPDESAVLLFNEIYYQLTKLEYEYHFDYNFNFDDYTQEIEANRAGKEHGVIFVFKMFFAFLLLRQNNTSVATAFQRSIYYHYHRTWDVRTNCAFGAITQKEEKYPVELSPAPCHAKDLEIEVPQWDLITNHFNPSSIREVLNLWSSNEEKITVLNLLKGAYKQISRRPVKIENVMNFIRASAFFSNLYSELGGKEVEQKVYSHDSIDNDVNTPKGGRPVSESLDELFTVTSSPAQREKLINVVRGLKGKHAVFALRVAALPEIGIISQVPSYSKAKDAFPKIGASSNYYKQKENPMNENDIEYYKRQLTPQ